MTRSVVWIVLAIVGIAVVSCGISRVSGAAPQGAGQAASISLSLTTVPTIRSVTVSPAKAAFGTCSGGLASRNTLSTGGKLGFPNGRCFVGLASPGIYPITITNTGIASDVYVNGTSANPVDDGDQWVLCGPGHQGAVACTGRDGRPGTDQYQVETFSPAGEQAAGLTTTPRCDTEFDAAGGCWVVEGASQREGIELIGPSASSDISTKWTMTITWTPVPSQR